MSALPPLSAIEHQIIAESLRRVAFARMWPWSWRKFLEADERELDRLANSLTPDDALFALNLVGQDYRGKRRARMRAKRKRRNGQINLKQLTEKQRQFLNGVSNGLSKRQAALRAGYSLSSANNTLRNIEKGKCDGFTIRELVESILRHRTERNDEREPQCCASATE